MRRVYGAYLFQTNLYEWVSLNLKWHLGRDRNLEWPTPFGTTILYLDHLATRTNPISRTIKLRCRILFS